MPAPSGDGEDFEEALEDAMRRAREIAEGRGPLTVVVITDAPPHSPADCPEGIDFEEEVRALLATGSRCFVVDIDERGSQRRHLVPFRPSGAHDAGRAARYVCRFLPLLNAAGTLVPAVTCSQRSILSLVTMRFLIFGTTDLG